VTSAPVLATFSSEWLRASCVPRGDAVVVRAVGEVDLCSAPVLARALEFALSTAAAPVGIVVDLAGVRFLACSGITVLLQAHSDARGRLVLAAARPLVARCVLLSGLAGVVGTHATVESALADLG
jgi:anti-sigma B factor antagonist